MRHSSDMLSLAANAVIAIALLTTPCLCILAYRTWTKSLRQTLSRTRSVLGLTSVLLTFLNWLALICIFALALAKFRSGFGAYIDMEIETNFEIWEQISFLLLVVAVILGFALKKSARIQAVVAGTLMVAIWVVGYFGGRN
jgi:hypothetical protein